MISVQDKQGVIHFIPLVHRSYSHHIKLFSDIFNGTAGLRCQKCGQFIPLEFLLIETIRDVDTMPP